MPSEPTSSSGAGLIELRLREPRQLFNSMDPSPFHERDLDHDAEEFIVGWAKEHHHNVPLEIRVHLAEPSAEPDIEKTIEEGIHNFFAYRAKVTRRRFRQELARGRLSLIIGTVFLVACLGAADLVGRAGDSPFYQILREGFIIAGWVAMWRPIEIFLYDWWPIRHEYRIYDRLSVAQVQTLIGKASY